MSSLGDRMQDADYTITEPTPDEIVRGLGLDPKLPRDELQALIVERWDELAELEKEILSEAEVV